MFLAAMLCVGSWLGCGGEDDSSGQSANGAEDAGYAWETKPDAWQLSGRPSGETVRITVDSGYCSGAPKPKIDRVDVTETDRQVSILVVVAEAVVDGDCAGIGQGLTQTVRLDKPLGERSIVDASTDPPEPRWP